MIHSVKAESATVMTRFKYFLALKAADKVDLACTGEACPVEAPKVIGNDVVAVAAATEEALKKADALNFEQKIAEAYAYYAEICSEHDIKLLMKAENVNAEEAEKRA